MDIKAKAIERIATQLASLVGNENFRIITDDVQYGEHTDVEAKTKKAPKVFDIKKDTDFYRRIEALKAGESDTLSAPGLPVNTIQSAAASIGLKYYGPGNFMTSRNKDGSVDVLRLS